MKTSGLKKFQHDVIVVNLFLFKIIFASCPNEFWLGYQVINEVLDNIQMRLYFYFFVTNNSNSPVSSKITFTDCDSSLW